MFHRRVIPLIAVVAVCAVCATPAAAQVSDKDKICSQVENRTFTVGTWASYNWTGGPSGGSTMRMAVVGKFLPHDGRGHLALTEPRETGALLIDLRRALLGGFHVVRRDRDFQRRFAGLRAGLLDEYLGHVGEI